MVIEWRGILLEVWSPNTCNRLNNCIKEILKKKKKNLSNQFIWIYVDLLIYPFSEV